MMTLKVLFVDYYSDYGARNYYFNLVNSYKEKNNVIFIDFSDNPLNKNVFIRYLLRIILPFYIIILQLKENYDLVISNGPLIYPIGKNKNCIYKWILYNPSKKGLEKRQSGLIKKVFYQFIILYEKYSLLICNDILTVSNFSKNQIIKEYPKSKVEVLSGIVDNVFYEYSKKNLKKINSKGKTIFIPNFIEMKEKEVIF